MARGCFGTSDVCNLDGVTVVGMVPESCGAGLGLVRVPPTNLPFEATTYTTYRFWPSPICRGKGADFHLVQLSEWLLSQAVSSNQAL